MKKSVLFLCTGNSCRSQMAEAILKKIASDRFNVNSAGSSPENGKYPETHGVNPYAYNLLKDNDYSIQGLHSKSWDIFCENNEDIDFAITLCDKAKMEMDKNCPVFPGQPMTAHWGVFDPAEAHGPEEKIKRVFRDAFTIIKKRIELFISLPIASLQNLELQNKLNEIGKV